MDQGDNKSIWSRLLTAIKPLHSTPEQYKVLLIIHVSLVPYRIRDQSGSVDIRAWACLGSFRYRTGLCGTHIEWRYPATVPIFSVSVKGYIQQEENTWVVRTLS